MERKLEELKRAISKKLISKNIMVTDIKYIKESNYNVLQIELDKANGLDLDTITEASNIINPIVDEYDITDDSYILDVISKEKGDVKYE